jgi:hypothetical protein
MGFDSFQGRFNSPLHRHNYGYEKSQNLAGRLPVGSKLASGPMTYLNFLRERAGAPVPGRICVLAHGEEWVNRQILDELHSAWPSAEVASIEGTSFSACDLLVVPFNNKAPVGPFSFEQNCRAPWVMLYGLEMRRIWVFESDKALKHLRTTRGLQRIQSSLSGTGLLRPFKAAIQIWKRHLHR